MDRDHWRKTLNAVKQAAREVAKLHPLKRKLDFPDWLIVAMCMWAIAHDRPQSWACNRDNYSDVFRPRKALPSVSQFNRRLNWQRTDLILQRVHELLGGDGIATSLNYIDGKPLVVGVASKDRDARRGHVLGGFAKGYKLHAWMSEDRRIPLWCVMPLNVSEVPVARTMIQRVDELPERSLTLVDQNYDTHDLHKQLHSRKVDCWSSLRGQARWRSVIR